jgi:hypothetical protein
LTLDYSGYVVGNNQPLNHARILWTPITGTVTADGANGSFAANDFTFQRWACGTLPADWLLAAAANVQVDTVIIAAHNLGSTGSTVIIKTAATAGGGLTTRATITPTDDGVIAVMLNSGGAPYTIRDFAIEVTGASAAVQIGIIRAGVALQMQRPVYGGVNPIGLTRAVETRHSLSETGQWLGRTIQRQARRTTMAWQHLEASWYRANFQAFSEALPQTPFALIQNPLRMPESVAWCWTDQAPVPENMGIRDLMSVQIEMTGLLDT